MTEIPAYYVRLLDGIYDHDTARMWWCTPQPLLGGQTPADMVANGLAHRVLHVINQLRDSTHG